MQSRPHETDNLRATTPAPWDPLGGLTRQAIPVSPAMVKLMQIIRARWEGCLPQERWTLMPVSRDDYKRLWQVVEAEELRTFFDNYIPHRHLDDKECSLLLLFMTDIVTHDVFMAFVAYEIASQMIAIEASARNSNPQVAMLISSIMSSRTSRVLLLGNPTQGRVSTQRSTDAFSSLVNAMYPNTETAPYLTGRLNGYPQPEIDDALATLENVNIVVDFETQLHADAELNITKEARLLIWNPAYGFSNWGEANYFIETLINRDGKSVEGTLELSLTEFVPSEALTTMPFPLPLIRIPFSKLVAFLQRSQVMDPEHENSAEIYWREFHPGNES